MRRFLVMFLGMSMAIGLLVVPSYATPAYSSTPAYPSGTGYGYIVSNSPAASPSQSATNFYTAVTAGLTNGFSMLSRGLYTLQTNTKASSDTLSAVRTYLFGSRDNSFRALHSIGSGLSGYDTSSSYQGGALGQINDNLYYGFQTLFNGLGRINTNIGTMDGNITSGFSTMASKLDSHSSDLMTWLHTLDSSPAGLHYPVYDEHGNRVDFPATFGGYIDLFVNYQFYQNELLAALVRHFDSAENDALTEETVDQKKELLDNFYGDDSKGVQGGQIGSLGDVSSSAVGLLDPNVDISNVFVMIGNSGSGVWDWFTTANSNAINGVGGAAAIAVDEEASPTPEIVDFYGAQREELLSLLGGD